MLLLQDRTVSPCLLLAGRGILDTDESRRCRVKAGRSTSNNTVVSAGGLGRRLPETQDVLRFVLQLRAAAYTHATFTYRTARKGRNKKTASVAQRVLQSTVTHATTKLRFCGRYGQQLRDICCALIENGLKLM